jgi:translation initiation factor 3 subunit C
MSRFFAAGSSSESESDSEEESLYSGSDAERRDGAKESSDEDSDEEDEGNDSGSSSEAEGISKFLRSDDEDSGSEEEEEKSTVVKSAKDKKFEELEGVVRLIENAEKIGDWTVISAGRFKLLLVDISNR